MTFDIVIPTYQRKDKLLRCLKAIPIQDNVNIWMCFDNNDFETYKMVEANYPELNYEIMEKKFQAFGIWNYHIQNIFQADIFVYLCDDTELFPDTLINVEKHFQEKFTDTDGVVTFKQANLDGSDSAMGCIGRKFIERYNENPVFNPNYVSFYADTDIGDYAKKLGKFHYGTDCLINHYHPVTGVDMDATHHIIRGKDKQVDIQINKIRTEKGLLYPETLEMIDRSKFNG